MSTLLCVVLLTLLFFFSRRKPNVLSRQSTKASGGKGEISGKGKDTEDRAPCDRADTMTQGDVRIGRKPNKGWVWIKNLSTCCLLFLSRSAIYSGISNVQTSQSVLFRHGPVVCEDPHGNISGIQWDRYVVHHLNVGNIMR